MSMSFEAFWLRLLGGFEAFQFFFGRQSENLSELLFFLGSS